MKLLAALQKEAQKLTKVKGDAERQLKAFSAAVKVFCTTLAADSANGRKKRGRKNGSKMSQPAPGADHWPKTFLIFVRNPVFFFSHCCFLPVLARFATRR